MHRNLHRLMILVMGLSLAGCVGVPEAGFAPKPTYPASQGGTLTSTAEPSPSPTATVSPTATLSLPATPTVNPKMHPTRAEPPLPLQIEGSDERVLSSLCLTTRVAYPVVQPQSEPSIAAGTEETLRTIGVDVIQPGEDCDADLNIHWTLTPISAEYLRGTEKHVCYSAVEVQARILLAGDDLQHTSTIKVEDEPAYSTSICREADRAPYDKRWPIGLLHVLHTLWGTPAFHAILDAPPTEFGLQQKILHSVLSHPYDGTRTLFTHDERRLFGIYAASSDNPDIRFQAIDMLGYGRDAVVALIEGLRHQDSTIRATSASELGSFIGYAPEFSDGAVPALLYAVARDPAPSVRREAAHSLGKASEVNDTLIAVLTEVARKDEDMFVQANAAGALALLGEEELAEEFVPSLMDNLLTVYQANATRSRHEIFLEIRPITRALEAITGKDYGIEVEQWRRWWESQ